MDLAMEEAAEAARLSNLLPQLQAAAEGEGGRRSSAAAAAMPVYENMDVSAGQGAYVLRSVRRMC
jgi:hypothetical protein